MIICKRSNAADMNMNRRFPIKNVVKMLEFGG